MKFSKLLKNLFNVTDANYMINIVIRFEEYMSEKKQKKADEIALNKQKKKMALKKKKKELALIKQNEKMARDKLAKEWAVNIKRCTYNLLEKLDYKCIEGLDNLIDNYINSYELDIYSYENFDVAICIYKKIEVLIAKTKKSQLRLELSLEFDKELCKRRGIILNEATIDTYRQEYINTSESSENVLRDIIHLLVKHNKEIMADDYIIRVGKCSKYSSFVKHYVTHRSAYNGYNGIQNKYNKYIVDMKVKYINGEISSDKFKAKLHFFLIGIIIEKYIKCVNIIS